MSKALNVYVTSTKVIEAELTDEDVETILTDYFCRKAGIDDRASHDVRVVPTGRWPSSVTITYREETSTRPKVEEAIPLRRDEHGLDEILRRD